VIWGVERLDCRLRIDRRASDRGLSPNRGLIVDRYAKFVTAHFAVAAAAERSGKRRELSLRISFVLFRARDEATR
jgi:hypothetical protein